MILINGNELLKTLMDRGLVCPQIIEAIQEQKVYATTLRYYPKIMMECDHIKGDWRVGDDGRHDWLEVKGNGLEYINMQCGDGTPYGYRFKPTYESPDGEKYFTCVPVFEYVEGDEDELNTEDQRKAHEALLAIRLKNINEKGDQNND